MDKKNQLICAFSLLSDDEIAERLSQVDAESLYKDVVGVYPPVGAPKRDLICAIHEHIVSESIKALSTPIQESSNCTNVFPAQMRKYRIQCGLTQYELAKKVGVGSSTVSWWERGGREPNLECLIKLSEIFDISIDALIKGELM